MLLSQILVAVGGIVTGKIIALYFSPEDFGLFNLQFAIYTFVFSLLLNPFLHYMKTVSTTLVGKIGYNYFFYLALSLVLLCNVLLYCVFSFFYDLEFYWYVLITLMIIFNLSFGLITDYFNIINKLNLFSISNLIKCFSSLILLGWLFYFNYKYTDGPLLLWILQLVGCVSVTILFSHYYKFKFSGFFKVSIKNFLRNYFKYATPLMVLSFWAWISNYFDRFVIEYFLNLKMVGIYNANYSVGSKFFLLLNPFFLTLLIPNIYNNSGLVVKKNAIRKYVKIYSLVSIPILILIYFFKDLIGYIALSKNYESGFYLIFWIAFSHFLLTIVFLYETIFYSEGKTKVLLLSNILSALFNIVLNVLLIPVLGLDGAFIATLLSFFIRLIVVQFYFKKL